ncbi:MAG TPA: hypothetical protein VFG70_02505 [Gaiellaceae bacterium]|nr:hypothetical protein [Gaiellaceae bacterium]
MSRTRPGRAVLVALAALVAALALPVAAAADDDVRRTGSCTRSSEIELELRADDGSIRVELEIETGLRRARWRVILLHERRTVFRGIVRTRSNGSLELRRSVPDWFGTDTVVVRATGPRAETCRVSAALR